MKRRGFLKLFAQAAATVAFVGATRLSLADGPGHERETEPAFVTTRMEVGRIDGVRFIRTEDVMNYNRLIEVMRQGESALAKVSHDLPPPPHKWRWVGTGDYRNVRCQWDESL